MKNIVLGLMVILAVTLTVNDAEAKRFGGGKSFGMQREMRGVPGRQASPPPQQAASAAPHANSPQAPAPAAQPSRSWLGPIAGLAAGLGLGALLSSGGLGGMGGLMGGLLNVLLIGGMVFLAFRLITFFLARKQAPVRQDPMEYAGVGNADLHAPPPPLEGTFSSSAPAAADTSSSVALPADFDPEAFLRVAKVNFIRLQAAFDSGNLDDLREFTSPEVFAEIREELSERGHQVQRTDVVALDAELLELVTEAGRHIASVHFHGLIREEADAGAVTVDETWHLSKPTDGSRGWVVAGIQQMNPSGKN